MINECESADLCRVSRTTFRKWVAEGLIHPVELPGGLKRRVYRRRDVLDFLERLGVSRADGS